MPWDAKSFAEKHNQKLKGAAATLGMGRLSELARDLEYALRMGNDGVELTAKIVPITLELNALASVVGPQNGIGGNQ